jgi:hypothetical protein
MGICSEVVLPYMVTLIMKWTSPVNSHKKTNLEHTKHDLYPLNQSHYPNQLQLEVTYGMSWQNILRTPQHVPSPTANEGSNPGMSNY